MRGGWTRQQLAEELTRAQSQVLVAELDGAVVGHAIGWSVAGDTEVMELAVHPDARRRGLGRALLRALLGACGGGPAFLEVRASNAAALALYAREGFAQSGLRRAYYADGEDAVLMTRPPDQPEERST